jgi:hypothetical protein
MFGLPDQRVLVANKLIGSPQSAIVGLRPAQVFDGADGRRAQTALSALAVGALDSFRAHRQLRTSHGPMASSGWARRMPMAGRSVAVVIIVPEAEPTVATQSVGGASTVRNHLSHAFTACGVHSQSELLALLRSDSTAVERG